MTEGSREIQYKTREKSNGSTCRMMIKDSLGDGKEERNRELN